MRVAFEVGSELSALAVAREAVVRQASAWGAPVDIEVFRLLVNEVLANAIEHGAPPIGASVGLAAGGLRVEVHDSSLVMPIHRQPSAGDLDGRGVWLVDRVASAWGVERLAIGKFVWFELRGGAQG